MSALVPCADVPRMGSLLCTRLIPVFDERGGGAWLGQFLSPLPPNMHTQADPCVDSEGPPRLVWASSGRPRNRSSRWPRGSAHGLPDRRHERTQRVGQRVLASDEGLYRVCFQHTMVRRRRRIRFQVRDLAPRAARIRTHGRSGHICASGAILAPTPCAATRRPGAWVAQRHKAQLAADRAPWLLVHRQVRVQLALAGGWGLRDEVHAAQAGQIGLAHGPDS